MDWTQAINANSQYQEKEGDSMHRNYNIQMYFNIFMFDAIMIPIIIWSILSVCHPWRLLHREWLRFSYTVDFFRATIHFWTLFPNDHHLWSRLCIFHWFFHFSVHILIDLHLWWRLPFHQVSHISILLLQYDFIHFLSISHIHVVFHILVLPCKFHQMPVHPCLSIPIPPSLF